ncbi:quinone oxidoreductase family protein [Granulicella sibirica]|uniref:Quinone oxidoreductase n=1 Tax=Granulicella sibirica TaxID=2479048 RepID=A0A4Q0T1R6_9BACT|nr:zinc-binding alcohol dehydrogenase family protein [Granulicella sibirica]RXH57117.1 Quinone oxidoreductase [Granulicella sibirica]
MKAAIVTAAGKTPIYADFDNPIAKDGEEIISVRAAALSNLTRSRASGAHYSSTGVFPAIAGTDGVGLTQDGRRVYFAMPEAPFGSLAEFCPINARRCVDIPDSLDDITAAAIANPGMSAWAGLVERGRLAAGETVLVNGATGTAGRVAVQLAKYLGAAKVIATGRNETELEELKQLGADEVIKFALDAEHPSGAREYEEALKQTFSKGIDVVLDYLWGESAKTAILALAKTVEDNPVRFVHVGGASGEPNIELPGAVLRSAALELIGSGVGSVSRKGLVQSIKNIFEAVEPAGLKIATQAVPLSQVESVWDKATGKPRIVFTLIEPDPA